MFRTTGDRVKDNMSARASYYKVSNCPTSKLKELHTSLKLNVACLVGIGTPSRLIGRANLHPAESAPRKGTGFYLRGQRRVQTTREDD